MKKIPTLFQRNHDGDRLVRNEVTPGCEWVLEGHGHATRKLDGTCCMATDDGLWKRREVKKGKGDPVGFVLADYDETTGKRVGWVPVDPTLSDDLWHTEAWSNGGSYFVPGTYELIGPKIQGNPEGYGIHALIPHDHPGLDLPTMPREFELIKSALQRMQFEGVIWKDGPRMAKIKMKDFGLGRIK